jgi:indole-3-glycerol phosphate synthase
VDDACQLMQKIPKQFIKLGFSGIHSRVEVEKYKDAGARGVLIGTSLMRAHNIKTFVKNL